MGSAAVFLGNGCVGDTAVNGAVHCSRALPTPKALPSPQAVLTPLMTAGARAQTEGSSDGQVLAAPQLRSTEGERDKAAGFSQLKFRLIGEDAGELIGAQPEGSGDGQVLAALQ